MNDAYDNPKIRNQIKILDDRDESNLYVYSNIELAARYSKNTHNFNILKFLLNDNKIDKEILNNILRQIVHYTQSISSIDAVELLIDNGADVNFIDHDDYNILMVACSSLNESANFDVVKLLIERGANINYVNSGGKTALSLMCKYKWQRETNKIAILLIEKGATINIKDENEQTELMNLIRNFKNNDDLEIMKLLISKGTQSNYVNCKNKNFKTSLMMCFEYDYKISTRYYIIKLLLDNKADIYIKNINGENILDIVKKNIEQNSDIYSLIFNYKNLKNDHLCEFDIDFIYNYF